MTVDQNPGRAMAEETWEERERWEAGDHPPPEGVEPFDHTADVGIRVRASRLPELFRRAARGSLWMTLGNLPSEDDGSEGRSLEISAPSHPELLRRWLQEILFLSEVEDFTLSSIQRFDLDEGKGEEGEVEFRLEADLLGGPTPPSPVREIKGVTWHGLRLEEGEEGWLGQVIFDV